MRLAQKRVYQRFQTLCHSRVRRDYMTTIKESLRDFCAHQRIINTHCHHLPQPQQEASLAWVLKNAYVSWKGISYDENRDAYIRRLSGTSYYYWLAKGLSACCGIFELLNEHNSAHYDARIAEILSNPAADLKLMRDACGYDRVILDAYWNPGGDNGCPALFAPAYRINMFLFGYHQAARDHNGNNPYQCRAFEMPDSIEEYVARMKKEIEARKRSGCVALKCAAAYDRGLDFGPADLTAARTAYGKETASACEIKAFQDFIFDQLCGISAKLHLPMQIHTGLGLDARTNAAQLLNMVCRHPDTTFSLMHGSYPWTDDLLMLVHNHQNIVVDLCWLPLLSPAVCERFLGELIDVCDMDRITWGCDTWHSFESYGAVLAVREVLSASFAKLVQQGRISESYARLYLSHILHDNAAVLYGL